MTHSPGAARDAGSPSPGFDLEADAYRRRIVARAVEPDLVVAELEDDFHHFRVAIGHDGAHVTSLECESIRWPWLTCPDAAANLRPLVGSALSRRFTHAAGVVSPRLNCTHQFDCAAHAIVHAARVRDRSDDAPGRQFDVEVPRRDAEGRTRARLWVDRRPALEWRFCWGRLEAADPPFDSAPASGFMAWADATLPPDEAEAAIVLRRGATIAMGRGWPFDEIPTAAGAEIGDSGVCYTMTPGRAEVAVRVRGTIRDFSRAPEDLVRGGLQTGQTVTPHVEPTKPATRSQ
jgi:hypothetical protein